MPVEPLESIFKKRILSTLPRLQRFVFAHEKYYIQVVYKPEKTAFLADHLSRSCLMETKEALVPDLQVTFILTCVAGSTGQDTEENQSR